jgi:ubiquinone biosynthesis protein
VQVPVGSHEGRGKRGAPKPQRPAGRADFAVIASTEPPARRRADITNEEARAAALPGRWRFRSLQVFLGFFRFLVALFLEEIVHRVPVLGRFADERGRRSPERFRTLLEGLGGGFVKVGQFLSMRSDILPASYCLALSKLFDEVPPFPTWVAKRIVERELSASIDELFAEFDDEPVGAASFGQVHFVTLARGDDAGKRAVVKVCRPGSEDTIETDGRLCLAVGWFVDSIRLLGRVEVLPVLRDAVKWTRKEIHYLQEGKNADHLHELTHYNPRQRIPYIYWELTTDVVLTMEYLEGPSVSEIIRRFEAGDDTIDDELEAIGSDRATLARNIWQTFLLQSFVGRVFHGDPHPGNVIALPENTVGFIDIGLLGRLNEEARREQAICLDAIAQENIERLFVSVLDILDAPRGLLVTETYDRFYEEVDHWLDACDNPGAPFSDKTIQRLINGSMHIARQVGLVLPAQTILFYKALLTVDAVVLRMSPEFDYKRESRRAIRLVRMYELEKAYAPGQVLDASLLVQMLLSQLPGFVSSRLQDFEQGQKQIDRKLNLVPVIFGKMFTTLAYALVATGVFAWADRAGYLGALWREIPRAWLAPALGFVASHLVSCGALVLACAWASHTLKLRSFVKAQRDDRG